MSACYKQFGPEKYDMVTAPFNLKVSMLKVEVIETLLYGCVTWTVNASHYDKLRKAHLEILKGVPDFSRRTDDILIYCRSPRPSRRGNASASKRPCEKGGCSSRGGNGTATQGATTQSDEV